jgi:hypothetical protein
MYANDSPYAFVDPTGMWSVSGFFSDIDHAFHSIGSFSMHAFARASNFADNLHRHHPYAVDIGVGIGAVGGAFTGADEGAAVTEAVEETVSLGDETVGEIEGLSSDSTDAIKGVLDETNSLSGNFTSKYTLSSDEALDAGMKHLGGEYYELGKPGSGVYRSIDGTRGFRMDYNSISGNHSPRVPHVHLERFDPNTVRPYVNNHIPFTE